MDKDQSHMTERIINLTLDIICLLTGERCAVVKMAAIEGLLQGLYPPLSGEQNRITVPLPHFPTPKRNIEQKILEVINQVTELLTGESADSSNGHMTGVTEDEITTVLLEESEYSEGHEDSMIDEQPMGCSIKRISPESSPRPYSWNSSQEAPHLDQGVEVINIKVEEEEEEIYVSGDLKYEEWVTTKEEDIPNVPDPERGLQDNLDGRLASPRGWKEENDDITEESTSNLHPGLQSAAGSLDSAPPAGSPQDRPANRIGENGAYLSVCADCGRSFTSKISYKNHRRVHSDHRPYSCSECGKSFKQKTHLASHRVCHMRACPFSCAECGVRFTTKAELTIHKRYHTGEKIHACPECGKEFALKSKLERHRVQHTGNKPFSCSECDYRTAFKSALIIHFRTHTGERPYACSVCGQDFRQKFLLYRHQRNKKH